MVSLRQGVNELKREREREREMYVYMERGFIPVKEWNACKETGFIPHLTGEKRKWIYHKNKLH